MNIRQIFNIYNRIIYPNVRYVGTYKTIKRPDPAELKMPKPGSAPSLMEIIKEKIRLNGPITVAEYMHIVITNPTEGYYMKKDVIGDAGDFVTSPEISQLFGEVMAIWFYNESQKLSISKPLQLVELGPGKGTLLVDFLKVLNHLRYEPNEVSVHLVEISETMQNIQANRLCISHRAADITMPYFHEGETAGGIKIYWYNDLKKVPHGFSWYIAHEFFDVLPIHKFEKTKEGWRELLIDIDENEKLLYRLAGFETESAKVLIRPPLDSGDRTELEISARSLGVARTLAQLVDEYGGIALIADYGHNGEKGDTFRAFHKHKLVDPLENPGQSDLTADVDFSQIKIAVSENVHDEHYAHAVGPVNQKDFLERTQAEARLQVLLDNAKSDEQRTKITDAYKMLVDPAKMGERFKFLALYPPSTVHILRKYPPIGFTDFTKDKKETDN